MHLPDFHRKVSSTIALCSIFFLAAPSATFAAGGGEAPGYRGVWYTIAQGKNVAYSGGLGLYPPHIRPNAIYAAQARKTFFVWGGSVAPNHRHLRIMVGYYDHDKGVVPRPVIVRDCGDFSDAHANPALAIDDAGHLWVFAAMRHTFPGKLYCSSKPFDIGTFKEVGRCDAYPQPWHLPGQGFFLLSTKYTAGRENYWRTSKDGIAWSDEGKLTLGGHYCSSFLHDGNILIACDWHNKSSDNRTNLYFLKSADRGETWTTVDGQRLATPLAFPANPALVRDYHSEKRYVFLNDVKVDRQGRPLILYVSSASGAYGPGPKGSPREWTLARWDDKAWRFSKIAGVDHNYDYGNLHIEPDGTLVAVGAVESGPSPDWCGGEISLWISRDDGATWSRERHLTGGSGRNHSFPRIPLGAQADFFAVWADGNPEKESDSHLYFARRDGAVFRLPPEMTEATARPEAWSPK
jgi:hypothetical protein